jgi:hypothetical protein
MPAVWATKKPLLSRIVEDGPYRLNPLAVIVRLKGEIQTSRDEKTSQTLVT